MTEKATKQIKLKWNTNSIYCFNYCFSTHLINPHTCKPLFFPTNVHKQPPFYFMTPPAMRTHQSANKLSLAYICLFFMYNNFKFYCTFQPSCRLNSSNRDRASKQRENTQPNENSHEICDTTQTCSNTVQSVFYSPCFSYDYHKKIDKIICDCLQWQSSSISITRQQ